MKVLQVVHQFLPRYVGGTELYVADLSRRLRQRGHEVALFVGGDQEGHSCWDGLEMTTVAGGTRGPQGPTAAFLATFGNERTEKAFEGALSRFRPDVVHFHHLYGLSTRLLGLARRAGSATCYTLHDYWFVCPKSQLIDHAGGLCRGPVAGLNCGLCAAQRLGNMAYGLAAPLVAPLFALRERRVRRSLATVDVLLAPSRFAAHLAIRKGLPRDKITTVDFGIPELGPMPQGSDAVPGRPLQATYLGAIEWSKGVHVLVEACQLLDPGLVRVDVWGDLAAYPDYSRRVQRSAQGLPVQFMGPAQREDLPRLLASSDLLVVPSLWYENSPLVVAEAFAAGLPVVASRVGALAEKVRDGRDGLLFPRGDARGLAGALLRVATEPQLLATLRKGTRGRVSREDHVRHMEAIYAGLLAQSRSGGP